MKKGQSTIESLISFTVLILIISLIFTTLNSSYKKEIENNRVTEIKTELENIALRSNFIRTSTAPYTKTPFNIPPYTGYTGNELTREENGTKISALVLAEISFAFNQGDKGYVVNRLDGEPI